MDDYYAILGLDSSASSESIKVAYRRLARETHPDQNVDSTEAAKAALSLRMAQLNEAYGVLSNTKRRREYDEKLRVQEMLIPKESSSPTEPATRARPDKSQHARFRPRPEVASAMVNEFSKHLRTRLLAHRSAFSWRGRELEGFDWALEALSWSSHYCVALRGFTSVDSASAKKLLNYSEMAIMRCRRHVRKSYFVFLLPFQQLSEWDLVSAQCQQFVTEERRARFSGAPTVIVLLDMHHGRTLRFGTPVHEKRFEELLRRIGTHS